MLDAGFTHRAEVVEAFEDLHTAEPAQSDAVTGLTEPEPGLEDGVQQIGFVRTADASTLNSGKLINSPCA
jgi:hypothetical protein